MHGKNEGPLVPARGARRNLHQNGNRTLPGFDNELFYLDKTMMLFGDAREAVMSLVNEVKQL